MLSRLVTSLVSSRRRSSTLTLAWPRWFGTAVVAVAAVMAATVAAAAAVSVAVSAKPLILEALGELVLTVA